MVVRFQFGLVAFLATAGAVPLAAQVSPDASAQPKQAASDSASTTASGSPSTTLIARGDTLYHGAANCYACHGPAGKGTVGPNLADAEWIHSKGTYDEIVAQILKGVPKEESKTGIPMPPKGGSSITDEDVKAVAAYVYSLRQK